MIHGSPLRKKRFGMVYNYLWSLDSRLTKGQIKPKADWRVVDSPKKRTNRFVLLAFLLFTANKTNSYVCFLSGEF